MKNQINIIYFDKRGKKFSIGVKTDFPDWDDIFKFVIHCAIKDIKENKL